MAVYTPQETDLQRVLTRISSPVRFGICLDG